MSVRVHGSTEVKDVDRDSMEVGRRYRVTMKDCGIEGEFTATFLGWGRYDWSDYEAEGPSLITGLSMDDEPEFSLWDNGLRLGPVMGYWTAYSTAEDAEDRRG